MMMNQFFRFLSHVAENITKTGVASETLRHFFRTTKEAFFFYLCFNRGSTAGKENVFVVTFSNMKMLRSGLETKEKLKTKF